MIEEANKISAKLKKNTVFSRYEKTELGYSLHMIWFIRQVTDPSKIIKHWGIIFILGFICSVIALMALIFNNSVKPAYQMQALFGSRCYLHWAKNHLTLLCCRHESSDDENLGQGGLLQVRVQNTKLGISTFWSLDKFQNNMAAMREFEQVCLESVLPFKSSLFLDQWLFEWLKTH